METKIFKEIVNRYTNNIEKYLETCFVNNEPQQILYDAMRYSLLAGGKRLRPILVQAFCELGNGNIIDAIPFAAAIEMVHTYSLIHDDLPCMDNDDYRRGRLTNHKVFGEANAVLAGDALLTEAFTQVVNAKLSDKAKVCAVEVLSKCAGALGMVGGQVLDMCSEKRDCTETEVLNIQKRKTGALIVAACQLGVIAAGGNNELLNNATSYAHALGLAFQIKDDILDVTGCKEKMGKAVEKDENKNTFVKLYGVSACQKIVQEKTDEAIKAIAGYNGSEFLIHLSDSLVNRDH